MEEFNYLVASAKATFTATTNVNHFFFIGNEFKCYHEKGINVVTR